MLNDNELVIRRLIKFVIIKRQSTDIWTSQWQCRPCTYHHCPRCVFNPCRVRL